MPTLRTQTEGGGHHVFDISVDSGSCHSEVFVMGEVFLNVLPHTLGVVRTSFISEIKGQDRPPKVGQPVPARSLGLCQFIHTGEAIPSEVWWYCKVLVWGKILQCELSVVHQEYPTADLVEISKEPGPKSLCEGPHMVPAIGAVEVWVRGADVVE